LIDLTNGKSSLAIESPWISNTPLWSKDSRSFVVSAESPVGTTWEEDDRINHRIGAEGAHLFAVNRATGAVDLVTLRMADSGKQPLSWNSDGNLILHTAADTIGEFSLRAGKWMELSSLRIPLPDYYRFAELASDGNTVVGDYQNAVTPPEIFLFEKGVDRVTLLAKLNPHLTLSHLLQCKRLTGLLQQGTRFMDFYLRHPDM
jgi:dipeptidyl aminopeptidase/acylaminoacyl peptidase